MQILRLILHSIYFLILILVPLISFVIDSAPRIKRYYDNNSYVYFLSVGHGDAILIKDQSKKLILIDAGRDKSALYRLDQILPFWINTIDIIMVTHPHIDHYGGMFDILNYYSIGCAIFEPQQKLPSARFNELVARISDKVGSQNMFSIKSKRSFEQTCLEGMQDRFWIVNKNIEYPQNNPNNYSIMSNYIMGNNSVLLTADAEYKMQSNYAKDFIYKSKNIIKVPHQGSKDALNLELLQKLNRDDYAIFMTGNNSYGHPNQEVIKAYDMLNLIILNTAYGKNIICSDVFIKVCDYLN